MTITIFVILRGNHTYVTVFTNKLEAEQYIYDHAECYVRHEAREIKE